MGQEPTLPENGDFGCGAVSADTGDGAAEGEVMKEYGVLNQAHFLESPERVAEQQVKFNWYLESARSVQLYFWTLHPNHAGDCEDRRGRRRLHELAADLEQPRPWVADIVAYRKAGMKVAVGLDDQSCTDISDPFQNLRIGMALIRTTHYKSAAALSVTDMLRLHTLGSAEVLGIADQVGTLTVGKIGGFSRRRSATSRHGTAARPGRHLCARLRFAESSAGLRRGRQGGRRPVDDHSG